MYEISAIFINAMVVITADIIISACYFNSSYNNRAVDKRDGGKNSHSIL